MADVRVLTHRAEPLVQRRAGLADQASSRCRTPAGGSRGSRSRSRGSIGAPRARRAHGPRSSRRGASWMERARSERSTSAGGGGSDHDVHPVALAEPLEAVEPLARRARSGPRSRSGRRRRRPGRRGSGRSRTASRGSATERCFIEISIQTYAPSRTASASVTFQKTRSGGTSPIRNEMPIASIRKTRTRRRRSRTRALRRSASPTKRAPFRGVTIQRPVVPFTSACAKNSILRSKSSTELAVERRRDVRGIKNAAHMMPRAARSSQSNAPSLRSVVPGSTQHLGWDGTVAPHVGVLNHIDVIRRTFSQGRDRALPGAGVLSRGCLLPIPRACRIRSAGGWSSR